MRRLNLCAFFITKDVSCLHKLLPHVLDLCISPCPAHLRWFESSLPHVFREHPQPEPTRGEFLAGQITRLLVVVGRHFFVAMHAISRYKKGKLQGPLTVFRRAGGERLQEAPNNSRNFR